MKRGLEPHTDEQSGDDVEKSSRHGMCEVCAGKEARYSCPKCEVKTCSVACVQIHKKELACDGIRDRTKFVPLRKMTKMDFMSDYYFLEECTRFVADRKSDNIKKFTRYNKELPTHLFRLRQAAGQQNIKLRFLLQNFSRHKKNSTFYDWKQRKIFWCVEWIFVNAGNLQYVDKRCAEDATLQVLLDKYLNPECVEFVPQKKDLEYYQSVGVFGLQVLLKAEGIKRSHSRFHALDVSKSLKENLAGKTLVEFPCIYVSYETQPVGFDVIDSDEDVDKETETYQASLNELYRKQRAEARKVVSGSEAEDGEDGQKLKKVLAEKRREERRRKREEFEKAPNNYLFADENLWDMFSTTSSSSGAEDADTIEREKLNLDKNKVL